MEPHHPSFQPTVVTVHVLDVIGPYDWLAFSIVHHLMCQPLLMAETRIDLRFVTAKHGIRCNQRHEYRLDRSGIHLIQLEIGQMPRSVLHHHHRDVICPGATGTFLATAMTSRAGNLR